MLPRLVWNQLQMTSTSRNKFAERVALKLGEKAGAVKRWAQDFDLETGRTHTPYGPYIQTRRIQLEETSLEVSYISPFAILWSAASSSHGGQLWKRHLCDSGRVPAIIFHIDESRIGNQLRPDAGRSFQAVHWTFSTLPGWYRSRAHGWFPFTFMHGGEVKGGDMSRFFCQMMRIFFAEDDFNFAEGVILQCGDVKYTIRATYGGNVVDEKAHKEILSVKGASGLRPCASCQNCWAVDKTKLADNEFHFETPEIAKFRPHTKSSLLKLAATVAHGRATMTIRKFDELAMLTGLSYNPGGLPWDDYVMQLVEFPKMIIWDWMHNAFASGGVGQYIVNGMLVEMLKLKKWKLEDVDKFKTTCVILRKSTPYFKRTFFADRVVMPGVRNPAPHIRAFAAEMIIAVEILYLFARHVLEPVGVLPRYVHLLKLFLKFTDIVSMGDRALHHTAELQQTVEEQHRLYLELMPQAGRPKLHYLLHTASCMESQGANFSCFPGERLLSIPKNLGKDCYREFAQSLTRRVLKNLMDNFADETAYEENIVIKPKWAADLIGLICLGTVVEQAWKGIGAISPQGSFKRNDIVCWRDTEVRLGSARSYYDMRLRGTPRRVVANVGELKKVSDTTWEDSNTDEGAELWIDMACIRTVTCMREGRRLYPRFPFDAV